MSERLHKLLASAGFGSRREIERWIEEGRVSVNGVVAKLGDSASAEDDISIDGRRLPTRQIAAPPRRVIAYYKPEGEITTRNDPEGRPTIFENLPRLTQGRWIAVGRLDINTSGLLLLTTDGELANRLMHPSHAVQREYAARVLGEVDTDVLKTLLHGVELEDGPARFESITDAGGPGANHWYHVTLSEGRNREVRRLWETQGVKVSRLIRVRYGPLTLPRRLRPGRWQDLAPEELAQLLELVGLPAETPVAAPGKEPRRNAPRTRGKMPPRTTASAHNTKAGRESTGASGKSSQRGSDAAAGKSSRHGGTAKSSQGKAQSSASPRGKTAHRATDGAPGKTTRPRTAGSGDNSAPRARSAPSARRPHGARKK
jgi:23S rRNA pseudouridine2605 synthase